MNRYENFISRIENVHRKGEQGVFFISGPSASGKDGLWKFIKEMKFIKKYNLHRPVSSTTRLPRIGERCGKDYFYVYPEDIIKSDGSYSENAINPIKFGSEKGRDIWYCYTKDQIDKPLSEGKSLVFLVLGSALEFYKNYFAEKFPNVTLISTVWTISPEAQKEKFFKREPNKTKEQLELIYQSRLPEREMYDKMIDEGKFDFIDNADIRLKDWKDEQIKNRKK